MFLFALCFSCLFLMFLCHHALTRFSYRHLISFFFFSYLYILTLTHTHTWTRTHILAHSFTHKQTHTFIYRYTHIYTHMSPLISLSKVVSISSCRFMSVSILSLDTLSLMRLNIIVVVVVVGSIYNIILLFTFLFPFERNNLMNKSAPY